MEAIAQSIVDRVKSGKPMSIQGAGTRQGYGYVVEAEPLDVTAYSGVVQYAPEELVMTVRCGTRLSEITALLEAQGQMLGFEPPWYGGDPTIGGVIASGVSGATRPWLGSVRDFVLGVKVITGTGEVLSFGGQVMKNVAGYDVSRLSVGAFGTLGIILEVSLRLLPAPARSICLAEPMSPSDFLAATAAANKTLPLFGAVYCDGTAYFRVSGSEEIITLAQSKLEGREADCPPVSELSFRDNHPVWRVSTRPTSATCLDSAQVIDWGGGQRFLLAGDNPRDQLAAGEHATLLYGDGTTEPFQPLQSMHQRLHQRLKRAFDPLGILNPGRMYEDL